MVFKVIDILGALSLIALGVESLFSKREGKWTIAALCFWLADVIIKTSR